MRSLLIGLVLWLTATVWLITLPAPRAVHCLMVANCQAGVTVWSQLCNGLIFGGAGLGLVLVARIALSIRRQIRGTAHTLAPVLSLLRASLPHDLHARLRGSGPLTVVVDCQEPLALCHGLMRPRILLSTGLLRNLSQDEIEAVWRHEWAHCVRRDPLRLVAARALAEGFPGVPLLQRIAAVAPVAQELAADRSAIRVVGTEALGRALLKVGDAQGSLAGQGLAIGAFSAVNARSDQLLVDARLDQLLGETPRIELPTSRALLPAAVLLLLIPVLCIGLSFTWCVALVPPLAIAARIQSLRAGAEPASVISPS